MQVVNGDAGERLNVLGADVVLKTAGAVVLVVDHSFPPGYAVPPHVHEAEDEMFYILAGEMTFESEGRVIVAGEGAFVRLPRGKVHTFRNESGRAARALVIASPGAGMNGIFRGLDAAGRAGALDGPRIGAIAAAHKVHMVFGA